MRWLFAVTVVFSLVSCAQYAPEPLRWPARVAALEGFTPDQKEAVLDAIDELNAEAGRTLVSYSPHESGSPIVIRWAKEIPKTATKVAGRAYVHGNGCEIQIASIVATTVELLKPVLWHELGHCAGLDHTEYEGEIMYRTTARLSEYDPDALERFFDLFRAAVGL